MVLEDVARTKILAIEGKKKKRKRKNVNMGTKTNSRGGSKPKIVSPFTVGFEARAARLNLQSVFQFFGLETCIMRMIVPETCTNIVPCVLHPSSKFQVFTFNCFEVMAIYPLFGRKTKTSDGKRREIPSIFFIIYRLTV